MAHGDNVCVVDSGVFSSGSDSEEQLPLLDDETTAPREADTIADCEYVSFLPLPLSSKRKHVPGILTSFLYRTKYTYVLA